MGFTKNSSSYSVLGHGDLATSLILVFPLFLAYEIGVMFSSAINGVDFVTRQVFAAVDYDRDSYLLVQLMIAVGFLGYVLYMRKRRDFSRHIVLPMVLESAIYALTLGSFIVFVMQSLLGVALNTGAELALGKTGEAIVVALGAGVYEEMVFRVGLMAGGAALLKWTGMKHGIAIATALVVSAALFSLAHHVGPHGEPFQSGVFVYRTLAGFLFGLIFYYRSLAHAVYTHFLYDVYVLVVRA